MNYLAHAFLSFEHPSILVGNMISDYVKGSAQYSYPIPILAGIKLHRAIDAFTDTHAATQQIKALYKPTYRLYAGAFADVVYDYFLANDVTQFNTEHDLFMFTQQTYTSLEKNTAHFPERFSKMFPYMQQQNWLYHYRFDDGMQKSFGGLARRAAYINETDTAFEIFLQNKATIQQCYDAFFNEIKTFAFHQMHLLLKN
ncbi:ACP phosphodiesterase [Ferruginibacter yonginensis]|uniref:ACP phosphodiesterase n=1 Tax=Ferruginibacter yonginensis TaxID=1310416 RepID=A0ABV8QSM8_9BACT